MRRTKLYQSMAVVCGLGAALATTSALAVTVAVGDNKASTYEISFVTHSGNSWTYSVAQTNGRALSHWDLSLGACLDHVTDADGGDVLSGGDPSRADPTGPGADASVKSSPLIKWDTTGGTFTITLDGDYAEGTVPVLAKTATNYGTGTVTGPDCSTPEEKNCSDLIGSNGVPMSAIANSEIIIDDAGVPSVSSGAVDIATFIEDGVQDTNGKVDSDVESVEYCQVPVFDSKGAEVCLWMADKAKDGEYINIEQVGCVDAEKGKFYAIEAAGEFSSVLEAE